MGDLTSPRAIHAKGGLFLLAGVLSAAVLLAEHPTLRHAGLLALCVWCFARAYYYAFYVIEHYVDASYRFAGLWDFAKYLLGRRQEDPSATGRHGQK